MRSDNAKRQKSENRIISLSRRQGVLTVLIGLLTSPRYNLPVNTYISLAPDCCCATKYLLFILPGPSVRVCGKRAQASLHLHSGDPAWHAIVDVFRKWVVLLVILEIKVLSVKISCASQWQSATKNNHNWQRRKTCGLINAVMFCTGTPVEKTAASHCMTPPPQFCLTSEGKFTKWKNQKKDWDRHEEKRTKLVHTTRPCHYNLPMIKMKQSQSLSIITRPWIGAQVSLPCH